MHCRTVILKSAESGYERLRRSVKEFALLEGYGAEFVGRLQLSLKEAFINAVRHGNGGCPGSCVRVSLCSEGEAPGSPLMVEVADCGSGFDPSSVPDPTSTPFRLRTSGRGVYIIGNIAEIAAVEPTEEGSILRLRYEPY